MEPVSPAAQLAASDELHPSMFSILLHMLFYFQAQPFEPRLVGLQRCWPGAGVPAGQQIVQQVQNIGAVTRAHQRLRRRRAQSIGGGKVLVINAAA